MVKPALDNVFISDSAPRTLTFGFTNPSLEKPADEDIPIQIDGRVVETVSQSIPPGDTVSVEVEIEAGAVGVKVLDREFIVPGDEGVQI